jgi:hypothetical protein
VEECGSLRDTIARQNAQFRVEDANVRVNVVYTVMDVRQVLNNIGYTYLQDYGKEFRTIPLYRSSDNRSSLCIKKFNGRVV